MRQMRQIKSDRRYSEVLAKGVKLAWPLVSRNEAHKQGEWFKKLPANKYPAAETGQVTIEYPERAWEGIGWDLKPEEVECQDRGL